MICMIEKWSKKVRGEEGRNKSVESAGNYLLPAWKRREKEKKGGKKKEKKGGKKKRWEEKRKDGGKEGRKEKEGKREARKQ